MTAPARRPDGRRERTRKALIEAGRALFAKRPSDAVSIDEIVDAAGVAKGSFYNHFPDKEALVREIARLARVELEAAIGRVNLGVEDPAARVVRAFCAAVRFAVDDPADARTLTRLFAGATSVGAPSNSGLAADISAGLAAGRFTAPNVDAGVMAVIGLAQAALSRALDEGSAAAATRVAGQIGAILLRGLGMDGAEAEALASDAADQVVRTG